MDSARNLFSDPSLNRLNSLLPSLEIDKLTREIDTSKELYGAGITVILVDLSPNKLLLTSRVVPFNTSNDKGKYFDTREIIIRHSCRADRKTVYIRLFQLPKKASQEEILKTAKSTLGDELINTTWSCTGSAIGWVLVAAEAGGGAATVGATWAAMPLTLAATTASTFQCGVAIGRSYNVLSGNASYNEWLDKSPTFSTLMIGLNIIQIADVAKTLGNQALLYRFLKNKGTGSGNILKMFKQLSRPERKRLAEELLKFKHRDLRASQKLLKQVLNGTRLLDDGTQAAKVYTQAQVRALISTKALELIAAGITAKGSGPSTLQAADSTLGVIIGISQN